MGINLNYVGLEMAKELKAAGYSQSVDYGRMYWAISNFDSVKNPDLYSGADILDGAFEYIAAAPGGFDILPKSGCIEKSADGTWHCYDIDTDGECDDYYFEGDNPSDLAAKLFLKMKNKGK